MFPESTQDRVYVGAYGLCLDPGGRLLMTRLLTGPDAGKWTLPGGGVLWSEHPDQAVLREMEEETGLVDLNLISVAAIYSHAYHHSAQNPLPPLHHVGIIYHLEPTSYHLQIEQGGTTDLCEWLAESEARSLPQTPLGDFGMNLAWLPSSG
jgi:ADP-ribose pyrophosphatase YjhB (NUDIX family)